jgi:hypothetical protein
MMKANFFGIVSSCRTWVALVVLAVMAQTQVATAQCTLYCNGLVNISLDQTCATTLTAAQILSSATSCPAGQFQVQAKINGVWQPSQGSASYTLTQANVGQTLEVRVRDLVSNNSCWGHILVEDKLAPVLNCADITVSCAVSNFTPGGLAALGVVGAIPGVVENCGSFTLTSADVETVDVACGQTINGRAGMSYAVKRVWTATDASGNFISCNQWIYFSRITVPQVLFPADVTIDCENPNTNAAATGAPYVLLNGNQVRLFPNNTFCELNVSFTDQVIPVCDGTYKILRTWVVMDWCAPTLINVNPFYAIQLIKVLDDSAPVVADCPADATVSVNQNTCCATVNLPDFIVADNCSRMKSAVAVINTIDPITGVTIATTSVTGSFSNFPGNNLWNRDTLAVFPNTPCLPIGPHFVVFYLTDDCGNKTQCEMDLMVRDLVPPVAVCDEHTVVAVGYDDPEDCYLPDAAACKFAGVTWVKASTFDDGSYDNCGGLYFTVQRMQPVSAFIGSLNQVNGFPDCFDPFPDFPSEYERATLEQDSLKIYCDEVGTTQMVIFRAYQLDANGNFSVGLDGFPIFNECMVEIEVQDKIRPTCTSPANVTVSCENFDPSLWAYGTATAYDNCCLDVTKVYNGTKGITHSVNYSQFDTVCNRGVITRTFRAYDCAGLSSQCTQRITVQYNQDYFLHLPGDRIVYDCDITGNYGEPVIFDEDCELVGTSFEDELITVVPDACYKIIRTWRISNWCTYNPDLPCVQIPNPNPNAIVNHPSNLNAPFLKVTPFSAGNLSVPVDFRSTLVSITPGAPQTDYTSFYTANANCYEYSQVIKIIDNIAPVIDNCPAAPVAFSDITPNDGNLWNDPFFNDPIHNIHDLCEMPVDLNVVASDICAGTNVKVRYLLFLDTDNSGDMETVVNSLNPPAYGFINVGNAGNVNYGGGQALRFDKRPVPANQVWRFGLQEVVANGKKTARVGFNTLAAPNTYVLPQLPHGRHKIKWLVSDGCGNETACEYIFEIKDGKAPTVVCLNGISVNIMPTGMIEIWDTELLQYTEDNCTPTAQLKTAICKTCTSFPVDAQGNPIKSVIFTCSELGTRTVRIWSIDASGNADYCETYVLVQDNNGNCPSGNGTGNKTVAGMIMGHNNTGAAQGTADVLVNLNIAGTNGTPSLTIPTVASGAYNFLNAVPSASDITITPVKDAYDLTGIDMLDVLKIQRHILGQEPLANNYRQIAADVNNSRSITSNDIVELRKFILGAITELPSAPSHKFVEKAFQFPNANNAFVTVYPEMITKSNLAASLMDADFEAIKIGDVTGNSFNIAGSVDDRSNGTVYFDAAEATVVAGQEFTVNFKSVSTTEAIQFTMSLNGLEVVNSNLEEGKFAIHNNAMTVAAEQVNSFAVTFRAVKAGSLSNMISASSKITTAAAFNAGERSDVAFRFNGLVAGAGFELMQNVPNPVKTVTAISFNLPEAATATLTFTNVEGRVIKVVKGDYSKGINTVNINRADLSNGIIFYQLDTPSHSDVKKMIIVD